MIAAIFDAGRRETWVFTMLAASRFIIPTPIIAANFLQSVEPLLYVLLLWELRYRPFAFGVLLAFGFLQREFTLYALPAVAFVEIAGGSWTSETVRRALK